MSVRTSDSGQLAVKESLHHRKAHSHDHKHVVNVIHHEEATFGERLKATYEGRPNAYQSPDELLADVALAAESLTLNRGRHAGYFLVRRFMRRVRTFGFHLATLDVTQHA